MKCPRIQKAQAISDTTLLVEFSDQTVKQYDIHRLLSIPMFSPLRQPAFFQEFQDCRRGAMALSGMKKLISVNTSFGHTVLLLTRRR